MPVRPVRRSVLCLSLLLGFTLAPTCGPAPTPTIRIVTPETGDVVFSSLPSVGGPGVRVEVEVENALGRIFVFVNGQAASRIGFTNRYELDLALDADQRFQPILAEIQVGTSTVAVDRVVALWGFESDENDPVPDAIALRMNDEDSVLDHVEPSLTDAVQAAVDLEALVEDLLGQLEFLQPGFSLPFGIRIGDAGGTVAATIPPYEVRINAQNTPAASPGGTLGLTVDADDVALRLELPLEGFVINNGTCVILVGFDASLHVDLDLEPGADPHGLGFEQIGPVDFDLDGFSASLGSGGDCPDVVVNNFQSFLDGSGFSDVQDEIAGAFNDLLGGSGVSIASLLEEGFNESELDLSGVIGSSLSGSLDLTYGSIPEDDDGVTAFLDALIGVPTPAGPTPFCPSTICPRPDFDSVYLGNGPLTLPDFANDGQMTPPVGLIGFPGYQPPQPYDLAVSFSNRVINKMLLDMIEQGLLSATITEVPDPFSAGTIPLRLDVLDLYFLIETGATYLGPIAAEMPDGSATPVRITVAPEIPALVVPTEPGGVLIPDGVPRREVQMAQLALRVQMETSAGWKTLIKGYVDLSADLSIGLGGSGLSAGLGTPAIEEFVLVYNLPDVPPTVLRSFLEDNFAAIAGAVDVASGEIASLPLPACVLGLQLEPLLLREHGGDFFTVYASLEEVQNEVLACGDPIFTPLLP